MRSKLIIIRGNSGSGKTTIAKELQQRLGNGTMLVSQDVLRREVLRVKDGENNPSIQLIYNTVMYGNKIGYDVILEGILAKKHYRKMLKELMRSFEGAIFAYYFDIPFEETLKRHKMKPVANDYGETELRQWWCEKDYLGIEQEKLFNHTINKEQIIKTILKDMVAKGSKQAR